MARAMATGKILCVDDDAALAELCEIRLQSIGYDCLIETNPIRALKLFSDHPEDFAVAIVDQIMPGMKGEDLAMLLVHIRPDIPVILSTGDSENVPDDLTASGIKAVLLKPATSREFADAIAAALN